MSWPDPDRRLLLSMPRLGPMAIDRLENVGIRSLADLREVGVEATVDRICSQLGSAAWRNRRQALERLCNVSADGRVGVDAQPRHACGRRERGG